jgi:hypothetical protein
VSPAVTAYLVENYGDSKQRSDAVEREDGGWQATGRGEECRTSTVIVDRAVLAQRTRRRVVSGGGEIGRQAAGLERGATRRHVAGAVVWARQHGGDGARCGGTNVPTIREWVREWMRAQRRFERKVRAEIFLI